MAQRLLWCYSMPAPQNDRRKGRPALKVIHRHRVGDHDPVQRESELMFLQGRPIALLDWINLAGVRTPLCICYLDSDKLRRSEKNTYYYDDVTADPRYEELRLKS